MTDRPNTPHPEPMAWPDALEHMGHDIGDPLPAMVFVELERKEFRLRHAVKQAGTGGVVITDEDLHKPAPPYRTIRTDGVTRLITAETGS